MTARHPSALNVTVERERDMIVVAVAGEVDMATAAELERRVERALANNPFPTLLVDLCRCRFMDSTGMHTLVRAFQRVQQLRGRFGVACTPQDQVGRVMSLAVPGMFPVYASREDARLALDGRAVA